uniref:CUB domain-containing protein n=1 Tax=Panagrolaimus superbus TaxID=310955 RepID=A0A914YVV2_9BILA
MDFTAKNGTISSPNYPTASTIPFKCSYRIIAMSHQAIRLVFRYIGIMADINTCFSNTQKQKESNDYIELQGGHKSNEQINRRYVCARYPFVSPYGEIITSGIAPLSITYSTSGDSDYNTGFSFDYEIIDVGCGGVFFQSTGTIKSPNFPERYHPHMYCIYEIIVAWDQRVRLNFDIFDVENVANQDDCGFDNVQVYDGIYVNEDEHGELLGRFCGMSKPPALLSKGNKMSVVFLSDRSVNGAGFSATYRGVEAADDCDQTFTNLEGIIEFNSSVHPRATQCNYIVMLPKMHRIMLTFENLTLPCTQGSLIPRNGMSFDSPAFPGISNLCDSKILPTLITQGNRAFLQFSTTAPASTYFRLRYEQFAAGCGGKITGISGFISAPQYPLKDSRSLNCDWAISVGEGNRVKLSFQFIDNLDSADTRGICNSFGANYIDVSDGPYADYNLIKRFCTKQVSTDAIISEGNQLSVKYVQHGGSYHGALFGFVAHFDTFCKDIILTEHHGSIQSPGFPGPIDDNTHLSCKWTIQTTPGSRISLQFHSFDLKSRPTGMICSNYLMVRFFNSKI